MNRCSICDYTEEEGSFLTNREPSRRNKVHDHVFGNGEHDFLCDECENSIDDTLAELSEADVEVEGS